MIIVMTASGMMKNIMSTDSNVHNGEFDDKVQYVNRVGRKVDGEAGHDFGAEGELEKLRERIEEENSAKADIQRSLSRWGLSRSCMLAMLIMV